MLDEGFMPDIEEVVGNESMPAKESRQTLMISATFSDEVQEAANDFLNNHVKQEFIQVGKDKKRDKLEEILQMPDSSGL